MPPSAIIQVVTSVSVCMFDILELNSQQWGNVKNIIIVKGHMNISVLACNIQNFCHWKNDLLPNLTPTEHHLLFCLYHFYPLICNF